MSYNSIPISSHLFEILVCFRKGIYKLNLNNNWKFEFLYIT